MTSEIVPFGKYRGQPVEALAQDRQYVDWLTAQPWFKERFGNIYTLIVNNFQEPSETPEHNALQIKFLDRDYALRFVRHLEPSYFAGAETLYVSFENEGFDVTVGGSVLENRAEPGKDLRVLCSCGFAIEVKPTVGDDYPAILRKMKGLGLRQRRDMVLFLGEYTGVGATREQFIAIFKSEQIAVVFVSDLVPAVSSIEDFFKESP